MTMHATTYSFLILRDEKATPGYDHGLRTLSVDDGWSFERLEDGSWVARCCGGVEYLPASRVAVVGVREAV